MDASSACRRTRSPRPIRRGPATRSPSPTSPPAPTATRRPLDVSLPLLVDAATSGSTVIAVVDRRPPLVVSHDAGRTWHEAGGGLPRGRAVAIADDDPDLVLYAARNRLYLSRDGGRFWSALTVELPEIQRVEFD